jgi:dephospho-CoA kinase
MMRIGLTGGIGSGKSTVAQILAQQGCVLIDADAVSHALTASGGGAMPSIAQVFGAKAVMPDGALNRSAMREMILQDSAVRSQLERILHPLIGKVISDRMSEASASNSRAVVVDIPLLVEAGTRWRSRLDAVWVVDCSEATQIARVQARNGWPLPQIEAVMSAQAGRAERLRCADVVIFNEEVTLSELANCVSEAFQLQIQADATGLMQFGL